jgi:hypothetical protein
MAMDEDVELTSCMDQRLRTTEVKDERYVREQVTQRFYYLTGKCGGVRLVFDRECRGACRTVEMRGTVSQAGQSV